MGRERRCRRSSEEGAASCTECPAGLFRGDEDDGCQPCDEGKGERCDSPGTDRPSAGPGFFVSDANSSQVIVKCRPPRACFGTCRADVRASLIAALDATNDTYLAYDDCPGGRGQAQCSPGYQGKRCSQCTPVMPDGVCSDDHPNGYYRLDGRCEVRCAPQPMVPAFISDHVFLPASRARASPSACGRWSRSRSGSLLS